MRRTPEEFSTPPEMSKADLHIHTKASDGTFTPYEMLEYVSAETDIAVLAVTDHDEIDGALEAAALAEQYPGVDVIPGIEVSTFDGHLIGLWVETAFPVLRSAEWTIDAIREQGGLIVVPHPMSWLTLSFRPFTFRRLERKGYHFDAIEVMNASPAGKMSYEKALEIQQRLGVPQVGGSDAHILEGIGKAHTLFPGNTAEDLREAINQNTTLARGGYFDLDESMLYFRRKMRRYADWLGQTLVPGK
ncbi:MAG: PHP domain-containing protein [Chloroflexi bacterium]|nr:PHP domain-containing protein [Chloroflexota bacterium]